MIKSWKYVAMAAALCGVAITTVQAFQLGATDQRISRSFKDEKLSDVLAWMSLGKYSFTCAEGCGQNKRLSVDFTGATLDEAMEIVAAATNGKWVQKGDIFTLYPDIVAPHSFVVKGQPINSVTPDDPFVAFDEVQTQGFKLAGLSEEFKLRDASNKVAAEQAIGASLAFLPKVGSKFDLVFDIPQGNPFQDDSMNTSPWGNFNFDQQGGDAQVHKQLQETLSQLQKLMKETHNSKLSPQQAEALHKQLAAVERKLHEIMAKMHTGMAGKSFEYRFDPKTFQKMDGFKGYQFDGKNFKEFKMDPKAKAEMEKAMQEAMKAHKDAFKMLDSAEMKKLMEMGKAEHFKMDPKAKAEMEKAMQEAMKAHGEAFKMLDSAEMKKLMEMGKAEHFKMDPKAKAEMEKAMQEAMKAHGEAFKMLDSAEMKKLMEMGKAEHFKMDPKAWAEMQKAMELHKGNQGVNFWNGGKQLDFEKFGKSLTSKQKEIMKSKGYLTPADLTPEQRAMLGKLPEGNFTISFSKDGLSFTIKSGK